MIRYNKKYSVNYILAMLKSDFTWGGETCNKKLLIEIDGDMIKLNSSRYKVFRDSRYCPSCGLKGLYFYKEKSLPKDRYHLNMYGIDPEGNEVLFTKDHILPKALGGKNNLKNLQTMCQVCNLNKADDPTTKLFRLRQTIKSYAQEHGKNSPKVKSLKAQYKNLLRVIEKRDNA